MIGAALAGCAEGVGEEPGAGTGGTPGRIVDAAIGPLSGGNGGARADASSGADAASPPGQAGRDACSMGEVGTCTCPGGDESARDCVFDATSPLDGYFEECPACPELDAAVDRCQDGQKNGAESDTDCGGPDCDGCGIGDSCVADGDCAAGVCESSVCTAVDGGAGASVDAGADAAAPTGCSAAAASCTFAFTPSNFDPSALDPTAAGAVTTIDCAAEIDTSGTPAFTTWCSGTAPPIVVQSQTGGPEIAVVAVQSLTLTGSLRVVGTRPLVVAVFGDATVQASGSIDADANGSTSGAGGGQCGAGMGQGGDSPSSGSHTGGGGGGGFGTAGGPGGTGDNGSEAAGEGGAAHGTPELVPLVAGCRGGHTSECSNGGGGGGGAVQLSASGTLTVAGAIGASGGNGARNSCGAGGGSGGGILLEAVEVNVSSATLSANGGDGSDGSAGGPNGASGSSSASAPGGNGGNGNGADGGSGGGGGYGRIHVTAKGGTCTGAACS